MIKKLFTNFIECVFCSVFIILLIGAYMAFQPRVDTKLENFDDAWSLGDPIKIEKRFYELLPQAESLEDKSIYLQLLSQIALVKALQKKFEEAHKVLDKAESLLTPKYNLAQVRILLERGRVFQQAGNIPEARGYFEQSFELSAKNKFDFHTINAAHMLAIVSEKTEDKIKWNQLAIDMAVNSKEKRAHDWFGSLYNNLGQNYLELQQFEKALVSFQKALEYRKKEGYIPNIRVAQWAIGRALRLLNRLDEALPVQNEILKEYDAMEQSGNYDIPVQMFELVRGMVNEELAEIYNAKGKNAEAKKFAQDAYKALSQDAMFRETSSERLERLQQLKK